MPEGPREKNDMESAVKANNQNPGQDLLPDLSGQAGPSASPLKISMTLKVVLFCFSVVTLSWFFEGARQCKDAATPQGLSYLIGGTLLTLLLVFLQAFLIYCEERAKGRRTRKIALFDKWYGFLVSKQKGDYTNRG
jgi:hypothetical protein